MSAIDDKRHSATNCSTTKRTASANSTTRCRAGGSTASTSRSLFAAAYLLNYHVLARPLIGHAGMVAEYQAEHRSGDAACRIRAQAGGGRRRSWR